MPTAYLPSLSLILPIYSSKDQSQAERVMAELRPVLEEIGCVRYEFLVIQGSNIGMIFAQGLQQARLEYVGIYSAYDQIDPRTLKEILPRLRGHRLLTGYIANPEARPRFRRLLSSLNVILVNLLFGLGLRYYHFCFIQSNLRLRIGALPLNHAALTETIVKVIKSGAKYVEVPIYLKSHDFPSKSGALRVANLISVARAYLSLFIRINILREKALLLP